MSYGLLGLQKSFFGAPGDVGLESRPLYREGRYKRSSNQRGISILFLGVAKGRHEAPAGGALGLSAPEKRTSSLG